VSKPEPDTDALLIQAAEGDANARDRLLARHRRRLHDVVALRLDRRLRARVDPSDVVQEAMVEAVSKLTTYLQNRPLPFFLWLRQLALEHLIAQHRLHIKALKRSVDREVPAQEDSLLELIDRLVAQESSPSERLQQEERRQQVRAALDRLSQRDREVLALRHLEQLSVAEAAAVLGISEGAFKVRHCRALQRLGLQLGGEP
jgi:RNA polymerase sigma-70 factor (ECF subfamily)